MSIEEIEKVYNELFPKYDSCQMEDKYFPELQADPPSALRQVEIVTLSSSVNCDRI